ncbi:hypothetical protein JCM33374_g4617 [Metschnikowia sp. JCM 33374]|nr:hypothetical protein JCM33374_g4617 [Metschnikowia sp. JCM 33374]
MLAKSRAKAGNSSHSDSLDKENTTKGPEMGKVSRLAALAKTRAAASEVKAGNIAANSDETSGSLSDESKSNHPAPSKLSSLAKAKAKGFGALGQFKVNMEAPENSGKTQLSRKANGGGLELRRKLDNAKKSQHNTPESISGPSQVSAPDFGDSVEPMDVDTTENNAPSTNLKRTASQQLSFELLVDQSGMLRGPQNSASLLLFADEAEIDKNQAQLKQETLKKRRRLSSQLFNAYTNREANIAKAKTNFSSPSPDDKVLNAQKQAFEQGVKDLSINDEAGPKIEPKAPVAKPIETKPFKKINVREELAKNPNFTKPNESFVIIGHVDAGKSTLMGRILYDLGTVDAKTVNKLMREAEKSGKGSFALAWVMDQTTEERSRGVTIDICSTTFETANTRFTAIDAPGHKDFVPQMIGGVSQADTALLVVDSITGEFEAGFLMDGQTKEHAIIAKNLGINKLCVAVNKLDKENWNETRFEDIKEQLGQFLTGEEIGFRKDDISFVPISGLSGCNVVKNDHSVAEFSWYKGPTLIERLEQIGKSEKLQTPIESLFDRDFNLAINDIYDVTNSEFKVKGKISSGMVQPGETILIHPTEDRLQVQSVRFNDEPVNVAVEGQIVSMTFKINQLTNKNVNDLSIGDIVSSLKSSVRSVKEFRAHVNTFNMSKPLLVGTPFVLFRNNASVAARVNKVIKTNGTKKKKMHLVSRQDAEIVIEVLEDRRLPVSKFEDNKSLGRVVLRREGITIGAGVVTKAD